MAADGTTADEPLHLAYGERALTAGTFVRDQDALNSKMPVSVLNALPVVLAARGPAVSWRRQLLLARLPSLLLGVLLGWLVWSWAAALGGPRCAGLALLLYTFCPNVLAHAHLVTTDIATALGFFAATYALWRHLAAPSSGRLLLAAGAFGAAQLTKATALLLLPVCGLLVALADVRQRAEGGNADACLSPAGVPPPRRPAARRPTPRFVVLLLVLGLGAVAALNLGFRFEGTGTPLQRYGFVSRPFQALAGVPVLRDVPLPLPSAYLQGLDMVTRDARAGQWSYLRGRYSQTGFRTYFLWAFLVKVPLATQILLALALALRLAGRARAPGADSFLLLPVAVLALDLSLFLQLDIGFRYFLPALPFLFVFASRVAAPGAWAPAGRASAGGVIGSGGLSRFRLPLLAVLVAWLAVSSFLVHPHYLAYFNEVAGGPAHGSRWLIDSNLDWGQDAEAVRRLAAAPGAAPLLVDPSGPVAGRIAVGLTDLVGRDPAASRRHAWLRDSFTPAATVGGSWQIFDITEAQLARCCAALPRAWTVERLADDLAPRGEPFAGGDRVSVRQQERLNDGMLGANEPVDAARTVPPQPHPVRAWFGVRWPAPQRIGRLVAFPGFLSRGPLSRRFLALDYVFQSWDGAAWRDLPGSRVTGNRSPRVEHRFSPVVTTAIRLLVERERNDQGGADATGAFRAACLEIAAYRQ